MAGIRMRASTPEDMDTVWKIRQAAFGGPMVPGPSWPWEPSTYRGFVAEDTSGLCGFLRIRRMGQFFGGRAVPMGGIATVAVDPYARGRGVASGLLDSALAAMREDGQPISTLFTDVPALYRGRGWERAGVNEYFRVPIDALRQVRRSELVPAPITSEALDSVRACYLRVAAEADGLLDRAGAEFTFGGLAAHQAATRVLGPDGETAGYLDAWRHSEEGVLEVSELLATSEESAAALLRSLASWAGPMHSVHLQVADPESVKQLIPAGVSGPAEHSPFYLRVVDLPAAVAARGWPNAAQLRDGLTAEIEVIDKHAPWHAGGHRLTVSAGQVHCEPASVRSPIRLHARALGPWFTGAASTRTLRRSGLVEGSFEADAVLDVLTASHQRPHILDTF